MKQYIVESSQKNISSLRFREMSNFKDSFVKTNEYKKWQGVKWVFIDPYFGHCDSIVSAKTKKHLKTYPYPYILGSHDGKIKSLCINVIEYKVIRSNKDNLQRFDVVIDYENVDIEEYVQKIYDTLTSEGYTLKPSIKKQLFACMH